MHVELWSNTKGNIRMVALIRAAGGQVQIEPREPLSPPLLQTIDEERQRVPDDRAFLQALELAFNGAYHQAKFIPQD